MLPWEAFCADSLSVARPRPVENRRVVSEREWAFEFDDRLVRERLLAAEREHMRRVRQKRLRLEPLWDEELPPPPEEIGPDVAAAPPPRP